jgi:hypothetical protein
MLNLPYSLVIEATDEPDFFGFYSVSRASATLSRIVSIRRGGE